MSTWLTGADQKVSGAHIFNVHAAGSSPVADVALLRTAALYAIEQNGARLDSPCLALRQRLDVPALIELQALAGSVFGRRQHF